MTTCVSADRGGCQALLTLSHHTHTHTHTHRIPLLLYRYLQQQVDHFEKMWVRLDRVRLTRAASHLVWLTVNAESESPSQPEVLPISDLTTLLVELQRAYGCAPVVPPDYDKVLAARLDPKSTGHLLSLIHI